MSFHLTQHVNAIIAENQSTWWSHMAIHSDNQNGGASKSESEVHLLSAETSTKRADRQTTHRRGGSKQLAHQLPPRPCNTACSRPQPRAPAQPPAPPARRPGSQQASTCPRSAARAQRGQPARCPRGCARTRARVWSGRGPGARAARACASGRACLRRRRAEDALGAVGESALARGGGGT
jgi:hypothetical protein